MSKDVSGINGSVQNLPGETAHISAEDISSSQLLIGTRADPVSMVDRDIGSLEEDATGDDSNGITPDFSPVAEIAAAELSEGILSQ